jgi:hypothetical protein
MLRPVRFNYVLDLLQMARHGKCMYSVYSRVEKLETTMAYAAAATELYYKEQGQVARHGPRPPDTNRRNARV